MQPTHRPAVAGTTLIPVPPPAPGLIPEPVTVPFWAKAGTDAPSCRPDPSVSRTLRDAVSYLVRSGWVQGSYYDQTASVFHPAACLVGAIAIVCYGGPVEAPAQHVDDPNFERFEAALTWLDQVLATAYGMQAYEFNDARGRTRDQVVEALLLAATAWDNQGGGDQ